MSWLGRLGCDLDLLTSTSGVVCGHVGTNEPRGLSSQTQRSFKPEVFQVKAVCGQMGTNNPRGRANKKFKGECCLKKYNTLEIVG